MNVALYTRVSTKDKGQTNENQLRELRAFAERLGYTI
jgi:DNA invertase Pin-like site-specific DNA recombinase